VEDLPDPPSFFFDLRLLVPRNSNLVLLGILEEGGESAQLLGLGREARSGKKGGDEHQLEDRSRPLLRRNCLVSPLVVSSLGGGGGGTSVAGTSLADFGKKVV